MNTPLRVIAEMGGHVGGTDFELPLDGILAFAAFREMPAAERAALPDLQTTPWALDFALPLETWSCETSLPPGADARLCLEGTVRDGEDGTRRGHVWGWCASNAVAAWVAEGLRQITKRSPHDEWVRRSDAGRVETAAGRFKPTRKPVPTRLAHRIVWFARGDLQQVERLLVDHVDAIGKIHNQGLGQVRRWIVEPAEEDWSIFGPDGVLMRRMPVGWDGRETPAGFGGIRAPYHHRSRAVPYLPAEIDDDVVAAVAGGLR